MSVTSHDIMTHDSNFIFKKLFVPNPDYKCRDYGMSTNFAAVVPNKEALFKDCKTPCDKKAFLDKLVSIVNHAYVIGEHSMWIENVRTDCKDLEQKLEREVIILLVKTNDSTKQEVELGNIIIDVNSIIGQILCDVKFDIPNKMAEFGMFAIQEKYQKLGLGNFLVKAAEERAKMCGCKKLQCEVLSPVEFEHDIKKRLSQWYQKLGYKKEMERDKDGNPVLLDDGTEKSKDFFHTFFKSTFPHLAFNLSGECRLEVFVKELM